MSAPWSQRIAELVRAVVGAPSYERYLAHMRSAHPDRVALARGEFIRWRLEERYSKPGSRCC